MENDLRLYGKPGRLQVAFQIAALDLQVSGDEGR
jgi:hypothetical protein